MEQLVPVRRKAVTFILLHRLRCQHQPHHLQLLSLNIFFLPVGIFHQYNINLTQSQEEVTSEEDLSELQLSFKILSLQKTLLIFKKFLTPPGDYFIANLLKRHGPTVSLLP